MNVSCCRLLPERFTVNTVMTRTIGLRRMRVSCRIREIFRLSNNEKKNQEKIFHGILHYFD
jgi:hypothetical protein